MIYSILSDWAPAPSLSLYQPRAWNAVQPSDPLPLVPGPKWNSLWLTGFSRKWPLLWIWKTISFPESKMPDRVGIDCTSHIRFLRGCSK